MIAIVSYGSGNISAIANIYKKLNIPVSAVESAAGLHAADKIILPGVGAFDWAMERLNRSGMREPLEEMVLGRGKPVLGICVGMQMLARSSVEGRMPGLGWIDGQVKRFDVARFSQQTHLPHMGWNDVCPSATSGLFRELDSTSRFYFLHSYYFAPVRQDDVLAVTDYHGVFASGVSAANVYGVQFHPEKSHHWGIRLLQNFAEL